MIQIEKNIFKSFSILILVFVMFGCKPDPGPGGSATITGVARHHSDEVPGTTVYIKYDAETSPGTDPAIYEDSTTADENAEFSFTGLNKGSYYLYGQGIDSTIGAPVSAGIAVEIAKKNESVDVLLPVTE